jgi:hypothetical protein
MLEGRRVARFVYATLAADTGVGGFSTLVGGRIYSRRVPQSMTLPACIVQLVSAVPTNTLGGNRVFKNCLVDVHLICDGSDVAPLVPIADRADAILQGAKGTQDGVVVVELRQDANGELEYDDETAGKVYTHQVQTYRSEAYAT